MRRWRRRIVIAAAVVAAIVALRMTVFRPDAVQVSVYRVDRGRVESTVVNSRAGTLRSRSRAGMSPGIAGLVAEVPAHKGEHVKRGQTLLRLDDTEHRAQVRLAERARDAARAEAERANLAAQQSKRDRVRAKSLVEQGLVSEQAFEEATTREQADEAARSATHEQSLQAEAALEAALAMLSKTVMQAPFTGVVLDVTTEVGEWISPSPPGVALPPVIDIIDLDSLYVEAPLDEADVARVRVGLPVRITMDAFRDRSFDGQLTYISSFVETRQEHNRTLPVEAVFNETELPANVLPGLSADLEIIVDAKDGILRVPTSALLEGDRVLRVEGGKLASRTVQTGIRNWEWVEVTGGLDAGDAVVVSHDLPGVEPEARVRIREEVAR